jgi:hypothetical protein
MPPVTYRFEAGHRWGAIAATSCFAAWFGFLLWAYLIGYDESMRRMSLGGLAALEAVPFGMGLLSLFWVNQVFAQIAIDEDGIEIRSFLGTKRREFREFMRLEPMGNNRDGFLLWPAEGRPFKVATQGLANSKDLRDRIQERISRNAPRNLEIKEFRPLLASGLYALLVGVGLFLIASPWWIYGGKPGAWMMHVMCDLCALLLFAIALERATTRVNLYPDRVEKRSLFGNRTVHYAAVGQVEMDLAQAKSGAAEVVRLIGSGRDLVLSAQYGHFTHLRDTLIERCKGARIVDIRPHEYR